MAKFIESLEMRKRFREKKKTFTLLSCKRPCHIQASLQSNVVKKI